MKIKPYLFLLLVLIGSGSLKAQEKIKFGDETALRRIAFMPCYIKDSLYVGNSDMSVKYRMTRKVGEDTFRWCYLHLAVGKGISIQKDLHDYANSLIMTDIKNNKHDVDKRLIAMGMNNGDASSNLFMQLVRNDKLQTIQMICGDLQIPDRSKAYTDSIPTINWTLMEKTDSVCGYLCQLATMQFRGRIWNAWFTTEVPVGLGPWKLSGLPGLILKANDQSNDYSFECIELSTVKMPIFIYDYPNQQVMTRTQYFKYEKTNYLQPLESFANGEDAKIWKRNQDGTISEENESWLVPYYPIELE